MFERQLINPCGEPIQDALDYGTVSWLGVVFDVALLQALDGWYLVSGPYFTVWVPARMFVPKGV